MELNLYIYNNLNLREFGLQIIRHLRPYVRCSLAVLAVFLSGSPGAHVAQALRFSRFIAGPPAPLACKAFWHQTLIFNDWVGRWRARPQKSALSRIRAALAARIREYWSFN